MHVYAYLSQVARLQATLDSKLAHINALRCNLPGGAPAGAGRTARKNAGEPSDHTGNAVCRLETLQSEAKELYRQLGAMRSDFLCTFHRVPNLRMQTLLEMRYISGLSWEEIAMSLRLSDRATYRLHKRAVNLVAALVAARDEDEA